MEQEQRDFIGYGKNTPRVEWPEGARIAVNIVINYEVGAELNPLDGDPERETSGDFYPHPLNERNLGNESMSSKVWSGAMMTQPMPLRNAARIIGPDSLPPTATAFFVLSTI